MTNKKVTAIYFSPTKGTKGYVCRIAEGISPDYQEIALTDYDVRSQRYQFGEEDLVVIGAPVYSGRLPQMEEGIFDKLIGKHTPAVLVVSYGNREYDDALIELKDCLEKRGFHPIAAGAFLAPHTFSEQIAKGRPNEQDLAEVEKLVQGVRKELEEDSWKNKQLTVQGNRPYREYKSIPLHPKGNKDCNQCGTCVKLCPMRAISKENPRKTEAKRCIDCFACVKGCPQHARGIHAFPFRFVVKKLEKNLLSREKKPELFLL